MVCKRESCDALLMECLKRGAFFSWEMLKKARERYQCMHDRGGFLKAVFVTTMYGIKHPTCPLVICTGIRKAKYYGGDRRVLPINPELLFHDGEE